MAILDDSAARLYFPGEEAVRAFGFAVALLAAVALVASLVPARRAASVDPVIALRAE